MIYKLLYNQKITIRNIMKLRCTKFIKNIKNLCPKSKGLIKVQREWIKYKDI